MRFAKRGLENDKTSAPVKGAKGERMDGWMGLKTHNKGRW